ncbi:Clavaminate synthase-like protein [Ramaria rubella]|nr:Clavaminate synthase-like protein [Ramaria rubella]
MSFIRSLNTCTRLWTLSAPARRSHSTQVATFGPLYSTSNATLPPPTLPSKLTGDFQFPKGTLQFALSPQTARKDFDRYRDTLKEHGILSIQLGFADPASSFMEEIVRALGTPATHSDTEGALWDIKFKPEGVRSSANKLGGNVVARSHTLDEFVWHTDASYEDHPPRFFGFHVLQPDNMGGGIFRVVPVASILEHLGAAACNTLRTYPYRMKVPAEFYRGKSHHVAPLIDEGLDPNPLRNDLIRYRGDIVEEPPAEHYEARQALKDLNSLLRDPAVGFDIPKYAFRENSILLMDNARFLHMRTPIIDPRRWLRRIRFHPGWIDSFHTQSSRV